MLMDITTIIEQIDFQKVFAVVGTIGTALMTYINRKQSRVVKEVKEEKKVVESQNQILKDNIYTSKIKTIKELFDFQRFSGLQNLLQRLFKKGPIDRFTLMFVMNGKIDFHYMTVLMDESNIANTALSEISPYSRFLIDGQYGAIIKETELGHFVWRCAPDFKAGGLDDFLNLEQIKCIGWAFVQRIKLDSQNDIVVYCSFSSEKGELTLAQKKYVELIYAGRIKPHIDQILKVPDESDKDLLRHLGEIIDTSESENPV
jgi:hypothetical protein